MRLLVSASVITLMILSGCRQKNESPLSISEMRCNGLENPLGTNNIPCFSWITESAKNDQIQTAWQLIVSSDPEKLKNSGGDMWDSGKAIPEKSVWISYNGSSLNPGKEYYWKVRVWDRNDKASEWSKPAKFTTGLFDKNGWTGAKWIGYEEIPDSLLLVPGVHGNGDNLGNKAKKRTTVPYFRKDFSVSKKIKRALVFVSGLGQYELYINGQKTGDRFLSPGWSDYRKTCYYNTFDVTADIKSGNNTIGAIVGNGFFNINRERYRKLVIAFGSPEIILKLAIEYSDGTEDTIITDEKWKTFPSPVTFSSIYGGEDYDARLEQEGWDRPGFDDSSWKDAIAVREPAGNLEPETDYPVKVAEIIDHKKITRHNDSSFVYDFGQNASGIIKISVRGKKGQEIRFTPGELLGDDSLVNQEATGGPYYFSYTLKGGREEVWMPRFTYYGFRYIQTEGAVPLNNPNRGNLPVIKELKLLHTRNSSPEAGNFKCSNELFNSIYNLIKWSVKSNLASVTTDCPHREKLGWLEQTHLMGNSIKFLYDIHNLYTKVIDDMAEAQLENGLVPDIAPEFVPFAGGFRDSPEWGSACVILPWDMYEWYGDLEAVKKAYPMMKRYLAYLKGMSVNYILSHGLGDWFDLGPDTPGEAQLTPKALTATSIWYYDTKLMAEMARLTGNNKDADYYLTMAENIRKAFNKEFFNLTTNTYSTGSQTAMAMVLFFGIVDENCRKEVAANLVKSIRVNNNALTAGDIGYRYLLRTLEAEGESRLIFDMNSKTDVPGYGYQLSKGATSLTESWAALKNVSNNHMMLGHLMEWFFSGIGGIRQVPGSSSYDKILITPEIVGDITWAEASFTSIHGEIISKWKIEKNNLIMNVIIPVNCKAIISIPQVNPDYISVGGNPIKQSSQIKILQGHGERTLCEVSSGEYTFTAHYKI
jgi:alpha-L-rhamnosidase